MYAKQFYQPVISRSELVDKFHKVANSKITDHGQIHHDEL